MKVFCGFPKQWVDLLHLCLLNLLEEIALKVFTRGNRNNFHICTVIYSKIGDRHTFILNGLELIFIHGRDTDSAGSLLGTLYVNALKNPIFNHEKNPYPEQRL